MKYIDVHSHISFPEFEDDMEEVLKRMGEQGVWTVVVGTYLKTSREALAFAESHENVFATVGLHPCDRGQEEFNPSLYEELIQHPKVVAVGECGLDYYRLPKDDTKDKGRQKKNFVVQIAFAQTHDKPLMIHGRPRKGTMDAYEDILSLLEGTSARGNVHFFVGSVAIAERFIKLGFTLSFTGVLTFTRDYDEVIKSIPLTSILSETDSPYATPVPHRGKRNEPSYVPLIVKRIAEIRGEDPEEVREVLLKNAERVFDLSPSNGSTG